MIKWFHVYTTSAFKCQWCIRLKELFNIYGFDFYEKDISKDERYREEFIRAGHKTVPQVYREGVLIGGYEATKLYLRKMFFEKYSEQKKQETLEELEKIE